MPVWIRWFSYVNPLSYEVDALRGLLIGTRTRTCGSTQPCWPARWWSEWSWRPRSCLAWSAELGRSPAIVRGFSAPALQLAGTRESCLWGDRMPAAGADIERHKRDVDHKQVGPFERGDE